MPTARRTRETKSSRRTLRRPWQRWTTRYEHFRRILRGFSWARIWLTDMSVPEQEAELQRRLASGTLSEEEKAAVRARLDAIAEARKALLEVKEQR